MMFRKDAKIWEWRDDPVSGRKRLKRVGPWGNLFKIDFMALLLIIIVLLSYGYIKTSTRECQAILHNPELYCPCLGGDYIIGDGGWSFFVNDSVEEVSGVG